MAFSTSGGFSVAAGSTCLAGDPEDQASWHASFRDASNNMYRTSYTDMSHGREVCVRSDYPSGYGGHVPSVRHDVLFRNTGFDMETAGRRTDQKRDAFPGFRDQILGIPTTTSCPRGAKKTPTHGIIPHNGTTTMLKPPWGVLTSKSDPLNHRTTPRTTPRGPAGIRRSWICTVGDGQGVIDADPSAGRPRCLTADAAHGRLRRVDRDVHAAARQRGLALERGGHESGWGNARPRTRRRRDANATVISDLRSVRRARPQPTFTM